MILAIFDTETTGLTLPTCADLSAQPHIIELGAIKIDFTGNKLGELSQLIKPPVEIIPKITKITGIKNEDVAEAPSFLEFLPKLKSFFEGVEVLVCHNVVFDSLMLRIELERCGCFDFPTPPQSICTVQEYQHLFGRRPSLKMLYEKIIGKSLQQTHRALDDAKALSSILKKDGFYSIF